MLKVSREERTGEERVHFQWKAFLLALDRAVCVRARACVCVLPRTWEWCGKVPCVGLAVWVLFFCLLPLPSPTLLLPSHPGFSGLFKERARQQR